MCPSSTILPDPPPFTDRQVRRGLNLNIIAGCLGTMWAGVALNMPYTMLLDALGANGVLQGLASTIVQLTLAAQIPGAIFVESLRRRKTAWAVIAIVHRFVWFIPAYVAWIHPNPPIGAHIVVVVASLSMFLGNFVAASWHSWMADLVPAQTRGQFWSTRQAWTMFFFLLAMAGSGVVLDSFKTANAQGPLRGFALIFAIATVLGVADIAIHIGVPEPPPQRTPQDRSLIERLIAPLQHPNFRRLAIAMGLWMFSCTLVGAFGQLYLLHVFDATYSQLSVLAITSSLGTIIAGLVVGYLIDRVGARAFGSVMLLMAPCFGISWFLMTDTPMHLRLPLIGGIETTWGFALIAVSSFFAAGVYSGVGLSHMNLLAATAPARGRTLAMAVQWTLIGLIGAGGPILGGTIMDLFPKDGLSIRLLKTTHFHFIHLLVILHAVTAWFVVLPIFLRIRVKHERLGMMEVFDRIVLVNPLRFASGIYHARVMTAPVTRNRRAKAVEAAGEIRAELAVADVAARLSDASSEVREAAAQSLGRIGTAEAIDALLQALAEPDTDLTVPLLRALRSCADARALPAVLARLEHENIEVVREAARALGPIGDPAAVAPLLDLIHKTRNPAIALAAAESLGRLGDLSAVYEILPRMRAAATPMARRAFAASVGELLGERDDFYRILIEEEQSHGAAMTPLFHRMRADWRRLDAVGGSPAPSEESLRHLSELDARYEAHDVRAAATSAFQIAIRLAERCHGVRHTGDSYAFLEALNKADPRFAAAVWYLAVLDGVFQRSTTSAALGAVRDGVEIQLAIFILSSWSHQLARGRATRDKREGTRVRGG